MPTFSSQPLNPSPIQKSFASRIRNRPFIWFGLPFLTIVVAGSYGLQALTRTRYDYHDTKVQTMGKEDELKMNKKRKKLDLREEYYRLQNIGVGQDEFENVRVPRPEGVFDGNLSAEAPASTSTAVETAGVREERRVDGDRPHARLV